MAAIIESASVGRGVLPYDTTGASQSSKDELQTREAFQDFVAGTFYMEMLKAMRQTHGKTAYLHGGQAEELFQSQLDQQIADDLARSHGAAFSDPLFQAFEQRMRFGIGE